MLVGDVHDEPFTLSPRPNPPRRSGATQYAFMLAVALVIGAALIGSHQVHLHGPPDRAAESVKLEARVAELEKRLDALQPAASAASRHGPSAKVVSEVKASF